MKVAPKNAGRGRVSEWDTSRIRQKRVVPWCQGMLRVREALSKRTCKLVSKWNAIAPG
jgi:hypothetical protein